MYNEYSGEPPPTPKQNIFEYNWQIQDRMLWYKTHVLVNVNDADSNEGLKYNHNVSAISSLINKFTAHINFQYKGHHF